MKDNCMRRLWEETISNGEKMYYIAEYDPNDNMFDAYDYRGEVDAGSMLQAMRTLKNTYFLGEFEDVGMKLIATYAPTDKSNTRFRFSFFVDKEPS